MTIDTNLLDTLLTPRARTALESIVVLRGEHRVDIEKRKAARKAEQQRAIAESRAIDPCFHGHDLPLPEEIDREEIARRALERGLLGVLHEMTSPPGTPYMHVHGAYDVPGAGL